jgi:hypothetical protein
MQLIAHNAAIVVEVEDRGIGVPGTGQSRVFDRYYRAALRSEQSRHSSSACKWTRTDRRQNWRAKPAAVDFGMVLRCN